MKHASILLLLILTSSITMLFSTGMNELPVTHDLETLGKSGIVVVTCDIPDVFVSQKEHLRNPVIQLTGRDKDEFDITVEEQGGNVTVQVERKNPKSTELRNYKAELNVFLPTEFTDRELHVLCGSGALNISNDLTSSKIVLSTASGTINFQQLNGEHEVRLQSASGSIKGQSVICGKTIVSTASGNIDIDRIASGTNGTLQVESASGAIMLSDVEVFRATLYSISGSIRCTIPKDFYTSVDVKTVTGSISKQIAQSDTNKAEANASIAIATVTGSITIEN